MIGKTVFKELGCAQEHIDMSVSCRCAQQLDIATMGCVWPNRGGGVHQPSIENQLVTRVQKLAFFGGKLEPTTAYWGDPNAAWNSVKGPGPGVVSVHRGVHRGIPDTAIGTWGTEGIHQDTSLRLKSRQILELMIFGAQGSVIIRILVNDEPRRGLDVQFAWPLEAPHFQGLESSPKAEGCGALSPVDRYVGR